MNGLMQKNKYLKTFKPVLNAMDEFFFGTDKVTTLPHIVDNMDIKRLMSLVIIALLPVTIASIYFWGLRVLLVIMVSYAFGGLIEVCFAVFRKKEIHEGFLVTGLIFPLILQPVEPPGKQRSRQGDYPGRQREAHCLPAHHLDILPCLAAAIFTNRRPGSLCSSALLYSIDGRKKYVSCIPG